MIEAAVDTGALAHAESPEPVARLRAVHSRMIEAVLMGGGLGRIAELAAEAARAEVAVIVPRLGEPFRTGEGPTDALERYVIERLAERPAPVPDEVVAEAEVAAGGDRIGSVLLLGGGGEAWASEVVHVAALACLTELAVDQAREEVEQNLRGSFLEDLRTRENLDEADVLRRGARLGIDLSCGAVAVCAEVPERRPRMVLGLVADDHPGAMAEVLGSRLYALVPAHSGGKAPMSPEDTLVAARKLAARLERHGGVGLSSFCARPVSLGRALGEAELVLDVIGRSELPADADVASGTYRLLFRVLASRPDEIESFYDDTVAPIVAYDEQYGTDLVGTLEAYLANNGSTADTARAIFAHRHTVAYRLDRVRELTGLSPAASEDRERLGLGLKAYRIIAPRLPR